MSALYSLNPRGLIISRFFQIGIFSLQNAAEASDIIFAFRRHNVSQEHKYFDMLNLAAI